MVEPAFARGLAVVPAVPPRPRPEPLGAPDGGACTFFATARHASKMFGTELGILWVCGGLVECRWFQRHSGRGSGSAGGRRAGPSGEARGRPQKAGGVAVVAGSVEEWLRMCGGLVECRWFQRRSGRGSGSAGGRSAGPSGEARGRPQEAGGVAVVAGSVEERLRERRRAGGEKGAAKSKGKRRSRHPSGRGVPLASPRAGRAWEFGRAGEVGPAEKLSGGRSMILLTILQICNKIVERKKINDFVLQICRIANSTILA